MTHSAAAAMARRSSPRWRRSAWTANTHGWSGRCSTGTPRRSPSTDRSAPRRWTSGPRSAWQARGCTNLPRPPERRGSAEHRHPSRTAPQGFGRAARDTPGATACREEGPPQLVGHRTDPGSGRDRRPTRRALPRVAAEVRPKPITSAWMSSNQPLPKRRWTIYRYVSSSRSGS